MDKQNNNKKIQEELIQNKEEVKIKEETIKKEEINEKIKLKIKIGFVDKYNESIFYKTNDIVEFEKSRAEELLKDPRKLVCRYK